MILDHSEPMNDLERTLVATLGSVPGVVALLHAGDGFTHTVWTVLEDDDQEVADRIYERELEIFDRFPDLRFDFLVTSRRSGLLESWSPTDMRQILLGGDIQL